MPFQRPSKWAFFMAGIAAQRWLALGHHRIAGFMLFCLWAPACLGLLVHSLIGFRRRRAQTASSRTRTDNDRYSVVVRRNGGEQQREILEGPLSIVVSPDGRVVLRTRCE